ncbi:MAG TPA: SAM-dependent methyltransferase, partial [Promineifilum sp.]|nr:SAM-dependent methyltransferase [Promineifilum sp.]
MTEETRREPDWLPGAVQLDRPSVARIYDYLLGGYHNFEIDRRTADRFAALFPDLVLTAQVNRAFLRRAASFVVAQGIDQFIDLGSGIPTVGNLHEVVQGHNADSHVVYVDIEPVAIAHSEALLGDNPRAARYAGINLTRNIILVMMISGGMAGLNLATVFLRPDG